MLAQGMANESVINNLIGIAIGWTWSFVAKTVENVYVGYYQMYDMDQFSDAAIYTPRVQQNVVIENNICHDVCTYNYGGEGVHIAQGSNGGVLRNNIICNTACAGYLQHYIQHNLIKNNIFAFVNSVDCANNTDKPGGALTINKVVNAMYHRLIL